MDRPPSPATRFRPALAASFAAALALSAPFALARKHRSDSLLEQAENAAREAMVPAPQDSETCFSPEEPCDVKLLKFVQSAKKSIDIAIYDINLDRLVHELLAKSRQIPVRIVVDRRQAKGEHSLVGTLIRAGASVRYGHQRGIMHNKFAIVDGARLVTGSFNFTHHASQSNNENQVYLDSPKIVERYARRFERIWAEADQPASVP